MTPTATRSRLAPARNFGGHVLIGVAVALVLTLAAAMVPAQRLPRFVPRMTIVNPTPFFVEMDVTSPGDRGWLSLGGFSRESVRAAFEVIDQGDQWVFRFRSGGVDAGEMALERADLVADKWRVTVPDEVAERLQARGVTPSAR